MCRKQSLLVWLLLMFMTGPVASDDHIDAVEKGNQAYSEQDYKTALEQYHVAETEIPESPELEYNVAGALYQQGKYEEALDKFTRSLNSTDIGLEGRGHYNIGNTHYRMGDYQKAILSYENALNINPDDVDAKFNLELARKMLKEQIKPEEQEQDQQQQQQEQQQQQQDQEQDQQEEQNQQQQDEQQDQQQNQQDQQQQQPQDVQEMSKEDAERILNALRDDEKDIQEKLRRHRVSGEYNGKDW